MHSIKIVLSLLHQSGTKLNPAKKNQMKNLFETPVTLYDSLTVGNLVVVVLIAAAIFGTVFYKMANPKLK